LDLESPEASSEGISRRRIVAGGWIEAEFVSQKLWNRLLAQIQTITLFQIEIKVVDYKTTNG